MPINTHRLPVIPILMLCVSLPSVAWSTSFDCKKAKSEVEFAICSDSALSALDVAMVAAYKKALTDHPLPSYVKARQKDWIASRDACEDTHLNACLQQNYRDRISRLSDVNRLVVYSNSNVFSYNNADLVVEFWVGSDGKWRMSVWGGFVLHRMATEERGKPVYVGCEFDGATSAPSTGQAISSDHVTVRYKLEGNSLTFSPNTEADICSGFGRLPEQRLVKISK